ncbi:MAG: carboxylesterase/lipase family protein [Pseudomonadota bacterium]
MTTLTVETQYGSVEGLAANGCRQWLGIPYAAPPIDKLRWHAPQPHAGWTGTRSAQAFGSASIQHRSHMTDELPAGLDSCDEDCLTVNVFAPLETGNAPLPVMVWIHGGGFSIGASSQSMYDGAQLAQSGRVIVVSINYRLGVLGFLRLADVTHGQIPATGNEGLLDQIAALQWVRDNIHAFGGDPTRVTAFGESAGAMSIASLCTMPAASGLFQRAIIQSGSMHAAHDLATANRVAEQFLLALPQSARNTLATATVRELREAAQTLHGRLMIDERLSIMPTRPVVDGQTLPDLPIHRMRDGHAMPIPMLFGFNRDEWQYFALLDRGIRKLDDAALEARLSIHYDRKQIATLQSLYGDIEDPGQRYCAIAGDVAYIMTTLQAVEILAPRQPVYLYQFDHPGPGLGGAIGACHLSEVPFVFGTLDAPGSGMRFGNGPTEKTLASHMQAQWLAFAETGRPASADWPDYAQRPGRYHFSTDSQWSADTSNARRDFWAGVSASVYRRV